MSRYTDHYRLHIFCDLSITNHRYVRFVFPVREALRMKTMPLTTVIALGVGGWTQQYELQTIASHPYDQHLIAVDDYQALDGIVRDMTDIFCNGKDPESLLMVPICFRGCYEFYKCYHVLLF